MSLKATYLTNVINYRICIQNLTVDEHWILEDFLSSKFKIEDFIMLSSKSYHDSLYAAVWLKFHDEQNELKFKLLWNYE